MDRQDPQRALSLLLKARDLDPAEPEVHKFLSDICREMGLLDEADAERQLFLRLE